MEGCGEGGSAEGGKEGLEGEGSKDVGGGMVRIMLYPGLKRPNRDRPPL